MKNKVHINNLLEKSLEIKTKPIWSEVTNTKNKILIIGLILAMSFSLATSAFACDFKQKDISITWLSEDTSTKGNWVGIYGTCAYILPNTPCGTNHIEIPDGCFSKPCEYVCGGCGFGKDPKNPITLDQSPYNWTASDIQGLPYWRAISPYWDEVGPRHTDVDYSLQGEVLKAGFKTIQYPVWAWSWNEFTTTQTDPRAVYYPKENAWKLVSWDDGSEGYHLKNGYFDIRIEIPKGNWKISLYAYDYEMWSRATQLYIIMDSSGHTLATKQIGGTSFDKGVYETFQIDNSHASTIVVRVYNDAGSTYPIRWTGGPYPTDKTINVLLSGIFLDKVK